MSHLPSIKWCLFKNTVSVNWVKDVRTHVGVDHTASDCGLRDHISKVFTMHLGGIHMNLSPCDQITQDWWKYHTSVCERQHGHVGQRESEKASAGEWYTTNCSIEYMKINIFGDSDDVIRIISLLTMLPPDAQTTRGPFKLNSLCQANFSFSPLHKPRRSTLTDRDTLWQQSTSGRISKAHRVVCMSKKKKACVCFTRMRSVHM